MNVQDLAPVGGASFPATASSASQSRSGACFEYKMSSGTCHVRLRESWLVGDAKAEIFQLQLNQVIQQHQPGCVIIDLEAVKTISSTFIGALLSIRRKVAALGGNVHLRSVSALIEDVLKALCLPPEWFPIVDTCECATTGGWQGDAS